MGNKKRIKLNNGFFLKAMKNKVLVDTQNELKKFLIIS